MGSDALLWPLLTQDLRGSNRHGQNTHIHKMKINTSLKIQGDVLNLLSNVVPSEPS